MQSVYWNNFVEDTQFESHGQRHFDRNSVVTSVFFSQFIYSKQRILQSLRRLTLFDAVIITNVQSAWLGKPIILNGISINIIMCRRNGHSMRHRIVMDIHSSQRLLLKHQRCASVWQGRTSAFISIDNRTSKNRSLLFCRKV